MNCIIINILLFLYKYFFWNEVFLALSFLFYGIYYAYIKNIKSYYVYLFLACITHYSLFFFVFILLAMPLLEKFKPKTISFFLILSFLLLLIPPEIIFKSLQMIGLTSSLEAKVLAYLSDDGYKAKMDSFVYYFIRFINVLWIYLLIVVLILKAKLSDNKFIKLLVWSLIFNNFFIAFPVVFDRYALFIKLLVVVLLISEFIKNGKITIPILFLSIFILIALVDFVQLLEGFSSIFTDKKIGGLYINFMKIILV
ncbi:EpsG family protein [Kaistella anthropi]|nr:EpsG family protein [Kaistella anthropi]